MKKTISIFSVCYIIVFTFIFMGADVVDAQILHVDKITKGWLWMAVKTSSPGGSAALKSKVDWLAEATSKLATGQKVTEARIAANGVKAGDKVGKLAWKKGDIIASRYPEGCSLR